VRERDDWLLLREQRIVHLETEIEEGERVVRDREHRIELLEDELRRLTTDDPGDELRIEIERRGTLLRQREAHIRTLEIEIQGRGAELHLLRTALDQAEEVLRKRDAKLVFLERQPERSMSPDRASKSFPEWQDANDGSPAAVIQEWQKAAADFASTQSNGGQELIDPYVLERSIHGYPTRLLIATRESSQWYDRFDLTEGPCIDALQMVREVDTVFDCGAHHGMNSLLYSRMVGPSGPVVAFDPHPMNNKIAKLNALLNNRTNIEFVDVALGSTSGFLSASVAEQCIALRNYDAEGGLCLCFR
jgi:hypothetical protein